MESLVRYAGAAAGQVDEFADQIRVHPRNEIAQVEVQVVDATGGFSREVITQRLRLQADIQERPRHHEGAARLGHLGAVHHQVAVDVQPGWRAVAGAMQHRRPEQAVEIDDVLADEVVQFGLRAGRQMRLEVFAHLRAQGLEAAQVADRRVQPDVEILAGLAGNLETEIRRVARDVPRAQAAFGIQPFLELGLDARQRHVAIQPLPQEAVEMAHFKEKCSESRSSGVAPEITDLGSFSSVGA